MLSQISGVSLLRICCILLLLLGCITNSVFAEERSAYDMVTNPSAPATSNAEADNQIQPNNPPAIPGSDSPSGWTLLLQIVFSLGLVVVLIYLLMRFLANRQLGLNQNGPMRILGSMAVGNGKSVQLVMIGETVYVLGIGENVQLIRHISNSEEVDVLLADTEMKSSIPAMGAMGNLLSFFRKEREKEETVLPIQSEANGTFEELLEKQWDEVNYAGKREERWNQEDDKQRGIYR